MTKNDRWSSHGNCSIRHPRVTVSIQIPSFPALGTRRPCVPGTTRFVCATPTPQKRFARRGDWNLNQFRAGAFEQQVRQHRKSPILFLKAPGARCGREPPSWATMCVTSLYRSRGCHAGFCARQYAQDFGVWGARSVSVRTPCIIVGTAKRNRNPTTRTRHRPLHDASRATPSNERAPNARHSCGLRARPRVSRVSTRVTEFKRKL